MTATIIAFPKRDEVFVPRCDYCNAQCLCGPQCTCLVSVELPMVVCGCSHFEPFMAGQECSHLLCVEHADELDESGLEWDGAPIV